MTALKLPFAIVLWNDAHSPDATAVYNLETVKTVHGSLPIQTAGWILMQDAEHGITLANEYCGDGEFRGLTHIPAAMVVEVRTVSVRASREKRSPAKDPRAESLS